MRRLTNNGQVASETYDLLGRVIASTQAVNTADEFTVTYRYDEAGNSCFAAKQHRCYAE